jgi:dipeptidyl-peptidase 4
MAQLDNRVMGANWLQAARFAPYKMSRLTYSTSVNPRWIGDTDRFWYQWDNSEGTYYYIVDPARGTKRLIFDNDRIAAELTRITKDVWDGQNLGIRNIQFVDENTLRFEVESTQDEEIVDKRRRWASSSRTRSAGHPPAPGPGRRSSTSSMT